MSSADFFGTGGAPGVCGHGPSAYCDSCEDLQYGSPHKMAHVSTYVFDDAERDSSAKTADAIIRHLIRERDEARAEVKRLAGLLDELNDHMGRLKDRRTMP